MHDEKINKINFILTIMNKFKHFQHIYSESVLLIYEKQFKQKISQHKKIIKFMMKIYFTMRQTDCKKVSTRITNLLKCH